MSEGTNSTIGEAERDLPPAESVPSEPAQWSARARRLLIAAQVIGAVLVVIGLWLFFEESAFRSLDDLLGMAVGLLIAPIGLSIVIVTARTLRTAPDQRYAVRPISTPRGWFWIIWGIGIFVSLFVRGESINTLKSTLVIYVAIATALTLSGALWVLRWVSSKIADEWPKGRVDAPPAVTASWPRSWAINWAGLIGIISIIVAGVLEVLLLWLALTLLRPQLASIMRFAADAVDVVERLFSNSLIVALLWVSIAIAAPMIEEACKAFSLRLLRRYIARPLDGLLIGVAAGLAFGAVESALYLSSLGSWLIMSWLRLCTLILHGLATGIVGVAYARSLRSGRKRDGLAGYARAVVLHGTWNTVALTLSLGLLMGNGLMIVISAVILLGAIALVIPRAVTAGVQTIVQEDYQSAAAALPSEWSPMAYGLGWRLMGSRPIPGPASVMPIASSPPVDEAYIHRVEDDLKSL
jgi:RsiW-degrading membrane proteinase PrsW (M82 family)